MALPRTEIIEARLSVHNRVVFVARCWVSQDCLRRGLAVSTHDNSGTKGSYKTTTGVKTGMANSNQTTFKAITL